VYFLRGESKKGTDNDRIMNDLVGENWREICGIDQKVITKGAAAGYNHEEQWKTVEADHKRWTEGQPDSSATAGTAGSAGDEKKNVSGDASPTSASSIASVESPSNSASTVSSADSPNSNNSNSVSASASVDSGFAMSTGGSSNGAEEAEPVFANDDGGEEPSFHTDAAASTAEGGN
jgi:hypothetical protein